MRQGTKKRFGCIAIFLALCGVCWALYLCRQWLVANWEGILFTSYFSIGLLIHLLGAGVMYLVAKKRAAELPVSDQVLSRASRSSFLKRVQRRLVRLTALTNSVSLWPISSAHGAVAARSRTPAAEQLAFRRFVLICVEHWYALFGAILVLSVVLLIQVGIAIKTWAWLFVLILTLNVSARHFRYAVATTELAQQLRRTTEHPYVAFAVIAAVDLITLAAGILSIWANGRIESAHASQLWKAASAFFGLEGFIEVLRGQSVGGLQLHASIAGLLFYFSIVRTALRFRDFNRTDQDWLWRGIQSARMGAFNDALEAVTRIQSKTTGSDNVELISLVGLNQLELARKKLIGQHHRYDIPTDPNRLFTSMLGITATAPVPKHVVHAILTHSVGQGVADTRLANAVGLHCKASEDCRGLATVLARLPESEYALTRAQIALLTGDVQAARDLLRQNKMEGLAELLRLFFILRAELLFKTIGSVEAQQSIVIWMDDHFGSVNHLAGSLQDDVDKATALGVLDGLGEMVARDAPQFWESIHFLQKKLREALASTQPDVVKLTDAMKESFAFKK